MFVTAAIGLLTALIIVHELGHYLVARALGVRVDRFCLGLGKPLIKIRGRHNEWALCPLPVGGYVSFSKVPQGEHGDDSPQLLQNKPAGQRALVMGAGVAANLVFAWVVLFLSATTVGVFSVEEVGQGVAVEELMPGASRAALEAGIRPGDWVVSATTENEPLSSDAQGVLRLQAVLKAHAGMPLDLVIRRNSKDLQVRLTPDKKGKIGVRLASNQRGRWRASTGLGESIAVASQDFGVIARSNIEGLVQIFLGRENLESLKGPVSIVQTTAQTLQVNAAAAGKIAGFLSVAIALFNVLPIPGLDGWQLTLLAYEKIRGKGLDEKVRARLHVAGLVAVCWLALVLVLKDSLDLLNKG